MTLFGSFEQVSARMPPNGEPAKADDLNIAADGRSNGWRVDKVNNAHLSSSQPRLAGSPKRAGCQVLVLSLHNHWTVTKKPGQPFTSEELTLLGDEM